ncbi:MAG: RDD family protein [Enterococcus lacertideformus]|uniref:RDD family protein n=1 Tax=Enterococcus lacertideformus TaxID=2771493 RepID=A0A931AUN9_9ENTE|nr:RDD family protein [Enterococcus lacertideformus]
MTKDLEEKSTPKINDQLRVGPYSSFSQKVLQSFRENPLSEDEIKVKQQQWEKYTKDIPASTNVNDFPNYFYAGFWIRLGAFLIDLVCIGSITRLTLGITTNLEWLAATTSYLSFYGFTALLIYLGYFILLTKLNHGQTIGKMIFGIRVICLDEAELSWATVLVREGACRFILKFPLLFIGYLLTIFTQKKQHIGDYFSNTSVVTLNLIKAFNQEVNA